MLSLWLARKDYLIIIFMTGTVARVHWSLLPVFRYTELMSESLDNIPSVARMRLGAKSRLPKAVFDFIDGGADDENTLHRNIQDFERYRFSPKVLNDVSAPKLGCEYLGVSSSMPLAIAPTGLAGLAWPAAERLLALAARQQNIPFTLGAMGSCDIEEIAATSLAHRWFQIYILKDREVTADLMKRAKESGFETLLVTVDVPVVGKRERDVVNGFTVPLKWTPRMCWEMLSHPAWSLETLQHGAPIMKSLKRYADVDVQTAAAHAVWVNEAFDPSVTWADLREIRDNWKGKLLVKGVLTCDDADAAVAAGVDGLVISNHGGRQLDGAISSVCALDRVAEHLSGRLPLILDSGIRRGSDVVKALCLGASAAMIGRATLYGAAVGGEAGINRVLDLLRDEIVRTLALIGVNNVTDLNRSYLSKD